MTNLPTKEALDLLFCRRLFNIFTVDLNTPAAVYKRVFTPRANHPQCSVCVTSVLKNVTYVTKSSFLLFILFNFVFCVQLVRLREVFSRQRGQRKRVEERLNLTDTQISEKLHTQQNVLCLVIKIASI